MTRCTKFHHLYDEVGNFCGMSATSISYYKSYREIVKKLVSRGLDEDFVFENFPEGPGRVVSSIKDDETRTKALNYVAGRLKSREKITEGDLKSSIKVWLGKNSCPTSKNHTRSENLTNVKKEDQSEPEIEKELIIEKVPEIPINCVVVSDSPKPEPFIPPALKKPACQDRSTFECCPDLKSHVIIEKVRGRCCGVLGVPVNQIPKDECPIEKNMQAATKPGLLDQGDTVFSRGGAPLPKTETRWGSSQSMSREEKKRMFCTVIITTKQLLVLKEWMKHVDADDELIGLDEMFNEIERMMEAA